MKTGTLCGRARGIAARRANAPARGERRRNFNNPFDDPLFADAMDQFNMAAPKQVKLTSGKVDIEIKPLPPGKPADFSPGPSATSELEAEADPRKAQAGDPLTVPPDPQRPGAISTASRPPVLSDDHGLRTYPPSSKFKADDQVNLSGTKTFEQVVIADGARTSLAAVPF